MDVELSQLVVFRERTESQGVISLTLKDPGGRDLPAWQPGAHIDVVIPSGKVRQYSLCGDPEVRTEYRIAVLNEPLGRGASREIHESVRVGDLLMYKGPRNHFPLEPAANYLLIAGGIGITPILAMAREISRTGVAWNLLYGGRSRSSMAFLDELASLRGGSVTVAAHDESERLDVTAAVGTMLPGTAVYCCGPEGLIQASKEICERALRRDALHFERFTVGKGSATPAEKAKERVSLGGDGAGRFQEFEVELKRSNCVLKVPSDRSILDLIREVNPAVLYDCEEGFCGTCETKVLAGVPEHHDSILTQAERVSGRIMMICVGRSRTPRLTLDA